MFGIIASSNQNYEIFHKKWNFIKMTENDANVFKEHAKCMRYSFNNAIPICNCPGRSFTAKNRYKM